MKNYILFWDNPKVGLTDVLQDRWERMTKSLHSEPYADFLTALIEERRSRGLTQQIVADRLRKPQSYIAKIEGGERRLDIVEFIALSRALDANPETLFSRLLKAIEHLD